MHKISCCFLILFVLQTSLTPVRGQSIDSSFRLYKVAAGISDTIPEAADVFMHIDKTIYPVAEDVWFSAYLLSAIDPGRYNTLYVTLINDMTGTTVSSQRFALDNGISSGNLILPDSLYSGEYSIVAYTNRSLEQQIHKYFRQAITIIGATKPPFDISFIGSGDVNKIDSSATVLFRIGTSYGGLASNGTIDYKLFADGRFQSSSKIKINAFGEAAVKLPADLTTANIEVAGRVYRGKDTMLFKLPVHTAAGDAIVKFVPASGRLVAGVVCRVAFEIRSSSGTGISTRGSIYNNDVFICPVVSDIYGLGNFSFVPAVNGNYHFVPEDSSLPVKQKFPVIYSAGWSMSILKHPSSDSFYLSLSTPEEGTNCAIIVSSGPIVLAELMLQVPRGKGRVVIPATDWPDGTAIFSLVSTDGKLQAQTAALIRKSARPVVEVQSDSSQYHTRSKVTIKLRSVDANGKIQPAVFSMATVLKKTTDNRQSDIQRYQDFDRYSMQQQASPGEGYLDDPGSAENILMQLHVGKAPVFLLDTFAGDGAVTFDGRKLKKPVEVLIAGANSAMGMTDKQGNFSFPPEVLRGPSQSKVLFSVVTKNSSGYAIEIFEKDKQLNDSIAAIYRTIFQYQKDELTALEKEQIRLLQGQTLAKVVVKANKSDRHYSGRNFSDECDGYVCSYGIFNCPNHPRGTAGNREPTNGETYIINGVRQVYYCEAKKNRNVNTINATWYNYEFPPMLPGDSIPPEIYKRTTLNWVPATRTDDEGNATISFYTNEVKGNFVTDIQGISATGVFRKRIEFTVSD